MRRKSTVRALASVTMITLLLVLSGFLMISIDVSAGSYDILIEDFEGSSGIYWTAYDDNSIDGYDYWGYSNYRSSSGSQSVWCAQIGTRSYTGNPNTVDRKYDDNMDALIYTYIGDVSGYSTITLYYKIWYALDLNLIFADDELRVISSPDASTWSILKTYTGSGSGWLDHNVNIPTSARYIGFWLWSRDGEELEGVYIDDVTILGIESTKPSSSVEVLPTYKTTSIFDINYTANDGTGQSGVDYVELYYRKEGLGSYAKYATMGNPSGEWSLSPIEFDSSNTGGDGNYEFYTKAIDNAGNEEDAPTAADASTLLDATKPTSSVSSLSIYSSSSSLTIGYNAQDNTSGSGLKHVELYYNRDDSGWNKYGTTFTSSPISFDTVATGGDGTYQFYSQATDNAGNIEISPTGNDTWTIVDTTNPTSCASTMSSYQVTFTFNVPFTANDDGSGIQFVEFYYTSDGGTLWNKYGTTYVSSPISFTASSDGTFGFCTVAKDKANNLEAGGTPSSGNVPDCSTVVDTTKPTISISKPSSGSTVTSSDVDISWFGSDITSGIDHYELKIDGGDYTNVGLDTSHTFKKVSDGSHTISIIVFDKAGNSEEITSKIEVDTNPLSPSGPYKGLPLYILIIIIIICVLLAIWFKKRKRQPVNIQPQEEPQEAIVPSPQEPQQESPSISPDEDPTLESPPPPPDEEPSPESLQSPLT